MNPLYITATLATEHARALRQEACASRLATLARCCEPTTWGRTVRNAAGTMSRLGAALRRTPSVGTACTCA